MLNKKNIPKHVAIIMDGNGRWAKKRMLPRNAGHRAGMNRAEEVIETALELGIKILTLFAFSTENWQRPKKEIDIIMRSLNNFLNKKINKFHKNNIRLRVIGREKPLPQELLVNLKKAVNLTAGNSGLVVVLALNYGGRIEIIDAATRFAKSVQKNIYKADYLNEEIFSRFLYAPDIASPDLLIRTSGEMRISNFLIWQIAYTELYFTNGYWPDFTRDSFLKAIEEYQLRNRRFGGL